MYILVYLQVSSRIPQRNSMIQPRTMVSEWCGTTQWAVQKASNNNNNNILKKTKSRICRHEWPVHTFIQVFLIDNTSSDEWYNIDIYTRRTTKLLTDIIKSFATLTVLIQNESARCFTVQNLGIAFVQGIVRVAIGCSPSFLLLWTLGGIQLQKIYQLCI